MTNETARNRIQFLRPRTLADRWGCSTTTLWRQQRRGNLPAPTRLSPGVVGWRSDVIEAIEAARGATSLSETTHA